MKIARRYSARAVIGLSLLVPVFSLTGCFATQQDLEPMRSDIMVLEKQFTEVQRQVAKAKYQEEDKTTRNQTQEKLQEMDKRLAGLEERMSKVEGQVRDQDSSEAPAAPQPIPPEAAPGPDSAPGESAPPAASDAEESTAPQPTKGMVAAQDAYNQAMASYSSGDYDKAEAGFGAFLKSYPNDRLSDDAMFMLGEIAFARKDYKGAVKQYQRVVDEYPLADRVPDALYKMGIAYQLLGEPDKAKESFTRVMDNYPYSEGAKEASQELEKSKSQ
jgi:tol-pal system protein YbgF